MKEGLFIIARGIGQVMFQNNALSGLLMLAGIACNSWILALLALAGNIVSTLTACLCKYSREDIRNGLYGFNGTLVGIAIGVFMEINISSMFLLLFGSALSTCDGTFDYENIRKAINEKTKLVEIQRSKGYMTRPSFSVKQIGELIAFVKSIKPDVICMVDNCYGEFVDTIEPSDVGADMVVGSLIKNPGGGLAPIGGYIAGTKECVENASYRMTCPGLGAEVGASLGVNRSFYQGFFLAPMVTKGALKGAVFAANIYEKLGFDVVPNSTEPRQDIIQAVTLKSPERLIAFCKGIQAAAPVDSYVDPEPWDMPGYDSQVIMAAGAFVQGSSIELSADGPVKEPYAVYFQGGLTWEHAKLGVMMSLQKLVEQDLVKLQ